MPIDLTLIAGGVAHQLRSALDHLVWQLVLFNTGQPPQETKSGFPIFKNAAGYAARAPAMIVGVSSQAATRIQAAQPYHGGLDAERALTWVVHDALSELRFRAMVSDRLRKLIVEITSIISDGTGPAVVALAELNEEVKEKLRHLEVESRFETGRAA